MTASLKTAHLQPDAYLRAVPNSADVTAVANSVEMQAVSKHYGNLRVFDHVSLSIKENEFVSILGPSGCGKTTLLRLVGGLEACTSGKAFVKQRPIDGPRPDLAMVFQNFRLLPWRTVEDNVAYGLRVRGIGKQAARAQAADYIKMVGLGGREKKFPYQLSGGMQQRVGLARALAIKPSVLLMDEPFGALDAQTREVMQEELLRIWSADRKTVMFVTHSIDEAIVLSDRVVVMQADPGRIVEDIQIPFERPRDPTAIRAHPTFAAMRTHMWELLRRPGLPGGAMPSGD